MRGSISPPPREVYRATLVAIGATLTVLILAACSIVGARVSDAAAGSPRAQIEPPPPPPPLSEVTPIACHSHNDFWRKSPLYSALRFGCIGVEADVWPVESQLLVAHGRGDVAPGLTFTSLYVEPLVRLLDQKPPRKIPSFHGVYDSAPTQTLVLLLDIKAHFDKAWPLLLNAVQPLRQQGWLSHLEDGEMIMAPITIVVTGEPVVIGTTNIAPDATKDLFVDAPLANLGAGHRVSSSFYWASSSFAKTVGRVWTGTLRSDQISTIRDHVQTAHDLGLKARYWGLPAWPASVREHVLEVLVQEGVDIINVDNLDTVLPFMKSHIVR